MVRQHPPIVNLGLVARTWLRRFIVPVVSLTLAGATNAVTVLDPRVSRVDQPAPRPAEVIVTGRAKRLFADDSMIEHIEGLTRRLHPVKKHPANPVLKPEKAWEKPAVLLFGTVMYDPQRHSDRFRMWYLCFTPKYNVDYTERYDKNGRIAYATSNDGIHWKRPALGIHAFNGETQNNIVIPGRPDSTCIIYDPLDPDPSRAYKAHIRNKGHRAYFSPDGIHWRDQGRINIDGHDRSTVYWNPVRKHWCASTKSLYLTEDGQQRRGRGYQKSADFLHWGPVSFMCATPEGVADIVYNLEPFYYETMFFGLWGRYIKSPHALLDVQLAVSHNGQHWQRPSLDPWIPLTPLPPGYVRTESPNAPLGVDPLDPKVPWDYANNSASSLGPIRVGDELWIYYSGRKNDHLSAPHIGAIGLATLRLDGFYSLDAGATGGTLLTRPLSLVHEGLHVNANAAGGELRLEITDEAGRPIPPFTAANCRPLRTDSVRHHVEWQGTDGLGKVLGKTVRLRFIMNRVELYAVWTGQERRWHSPDTSTWGIRASNTVRHPESISQ